MSNNFYQALNSISDSVTKAIATPKEIKITDEVVLAESTPIDFQRYLRTYRHCRDFEYPPCGNALSLLLHL